MAELLTRPRQTAFLFPRYFIVIVKGVGAWAWALRRGIGQDKRGPGSRLASYPGPPAVTVAWRRAVQHSLYACSPRCCPGPGGRARGRCRRRFGSLIADAAASGCACVAGVTEDRCIARRTAPRRAGRRRCGRPASGTKEAAVARITTRSGNGGTEHGARCGGARTKKW
jgi:hypothetical protein